MSAVLLDERGGELRVVTRSGRVYATTDSRHRIYSAFSAMFTSFTVRAFALPRRRWSEDHRRVVRERGIRALPAVDAEKRDGDVHVLVLAEHAGPVLQHERRERR